MIHNEKMIKGYKINAADDELGKTDAFLFDDEDWAIRYLVADTRKWLPGRKVLISPISIEKINHEEEHITVNLTKQQVKESPDIDADQPVSREQEVKMNQFYGWGNYWGTPGLWGPDLYPSELIGQEIAEDVNENPGESRLRKTSEIEGYQIVAEDGEGGEVESFLVDDETWRIRYIIIDTKTWGNGKKVLISPAWITEVSWSEKNIHTAIQKASLDQAPEYDPDQPIDRAYEEKVYNSFRKEPYWERKN